MKSIFTVFISFFIICNSFCFCQGKMTRVAKGKIDMTISLNGEPLPYFDDVYFIFDGHYLLEENSMQPSSGGPHGKGKRYILTNLEAKMVAEFEYADSAWKVVSRYGMEDKKFGLQYSMEVPQVAGHTKNFRPEGDTVFQNKVSRVLIDTHSRPNPIGNKSGILQKTIVYLETGRHNIPISISNYLDKKFGGWSYRVDMFIEVNDPQSNQKQQYTTVYQMNLTEKLGKEVESLLSIFKSLL